jgi:TP901 family phage tail tape measure protein
MPNQVVKTTFTAADRLTPIMKRMGIQTDKTTGKMTRGFRKATRSARVFQGVLGGMLVSGAIQRTSAIAMRSIRGLAEEYLDFDKNITKAISRLPGQLGRGSKEFKKFSDAARQEAAKTEFTAGQTAKAVEQMALAGFDAAKTLALLPQVLQLATNADVEVVDATKIAIKTMNAFGLATGTTTEQVAALIKVNDMMSAGISSSTMDIEQLFQTLKFVGPNASAAGQNMSTMVAVIGKLHDNAIEASTAGTQLRMALARLAGPTGAAKKLIRDLGIEVENPLKKGTYANFINIVASVAEKTKRLGNRARTAALKEIFGVRAMTSMTKLVDIGADKLRDFAVRLEKSNGASKAMATTIRQSLLVRLLKLKSVLVETGFKLIEAFGGDAGKGIDSLTEKIAKFDMKPLVNDLKRIIELDIKPAIQDMRDFFSFAKKLYGFLRENKQLVRAMATLWISYKGALLLAAGAQGVLNIAMLANPFGLLIAGLTTAIALLFMFDDSTWSVEQGLLFMETGFEKFKLTALEAIKKVADGVKWLATLMDFEFEGDKSLQKSIDATKLQLKRLDIQGRDLQEEIGGRSARRGPQIKRGAASPVFGDKGRFQTPSDFKGFPLPATDSLATIKKSNDLLLRNQEIMRSINALTGQTSSFEDTRPEAPNQAEADVLKTMTKVLIQFENAPENVKVAKQTQSGAASVDVQGLGQNP